MAFFWDMTIPDKRYAVIAFQEPAKMSMHAAYILFRTRID